jgi:dTDP-4-dehydrorhamnose 3,5-epimerase
MKVRETTLPGVLLIEPQVFRDTRGFFVEVFSTAAMDGTGISVDFVQDNHSRSVRNVLRGLHYQLESPQGKLIHVARGKIFDVAVDVRRNSPTFAKWYGTVLDDENLRSLWVPPGFAHGFCTLSDWADITYKCTQLYDAADERGIAWNDPTVGIEWPIESPVVSARDSALPTISAAADALPLA